MARKRESLCKGGECRSLRVNFQSLCDLHDECTFMAPCGLWHQMVKKLVYFQNRGL